MLLLLLLSPQSEAMAVDEVTQFHLGCTMRSLLLLLLLLLLLGDG